MITAAVVSLVLWIVPPAPSPMPQVIIGPCPQRVTTSCYEPGGGPVYANPMVLGHKFDLQHELGHAYDEEDLTPHQRLAVEHMLGWRGWRPEQFADLYASCRLAIYPGDRRGDLSGVWYRRMSVAAAARVCAEVAE